MAKLCSYEVYDENGDPQWICEAPSTEVIDSVVVLLVNEFWADGGSEEPNVPTVFRELCSKHAEQVKRAHAAAIVKEAPDAVHVQVETT